MAVFGLADTRWKPDFAELFKCFSNLNNKPYYFDCAIWSKEVL